MAGAGAEDEIRNKGGAGAENKKNLAPQHRKELFKTSFLSQWRVSLKQLIEKS